MIDPADTRRHVARHLAMLEGKTVERPYRKHGNVPL